MSQRASNAQRKMLPYNSSSCRAVAVTTATVAYMFWLQRIGSGDSESGIHGGEPSPFRAAGGATPHQQPGEPSAAPEPSAQESSAWPQPCPASQPIIVMHCRESRMEFLYSLASALSCIMSSHCHE